ncbi:MAG: FtsX-like permease family protein [bacterium]|nr:FtsX-like permease family protein [bacterium]
MQKILRKRVLRDLRANLLRYLALGAMIVLSLYIVVSLIGAADTVMTGVDQKAEENRLEDGEFSVFSPLTEEQISELTAKGMELESMSYLDYEQEDNSTLRVFKNRDEMNKIALDKGKMAEKKKEAVLEKRYCEEHKLSVGDSFRICGESYKIVGIGSVPDYDAVYKNFAEACVESDRFGLAFVTEDQYKSLKEANKSSKSEEYVYAYRLHDHLTDDAVKEEVKKLKDNTLIQFMKSEDNQRIKASSQDQVINKMSGLIAGVIIMILFTYVISVFVIHGIEKESSIIGTLYALGAKKRELMFHYIMLPVVITFVAGVIGTALGFSSLGIDRQLKECYDYFSIPKLPSVYPVYLILYGVIMPPVVAALVNCFVIQKKLSVPALKMIRGEQKERRMCRLNLGRLRFVRRFQLRQMLREIRTAFTIVFGMFICLLIVMLALDCYSMCHHVSVDNKADTKYEYMYTYKYPDEQIPDGGVAAYAKTLSKENFGYDLDVTLLGINKENPYFDAEVETGKNKVIISSAMAQKYKLKKGQKLILSDLEEDMDYAFTIKGICNYSAGLYAFLDIDSMRELMGEDSGYYNVVFSDKKLEIAGEKLYATTSKQDIEKSSDVFIDHMKPMIYMLTSLSIVILFLVMYLMMKVMIDRSSFNISLIKIFGYHTNEIRTLYLNGNFYIVALSALVCIPLAKKVMDMVYPLLVSNIGGGMNIAFSPQMYLAIYTGIVVIYLVISQLLVRKVNQMSFVEVLKNRE